MSGIWVIGNDERAARSGRRLALLLLLAAAAGHAGCQVQAHGELSAGECADGLDQDHDGVTDCDDSDCWIYEICGQPAKAERVATNAGTRASVQEDAGRTPLPELDGASSPEPLDTAVPYADAGPAGSIPCGEVGGSYCSGDDVCFLGTCFPANAEPQTYLLRIASANLPVQRGLGACFDTLDIGCLGVFECSKCLPDPYVVTTLNGSVQNQTGVAKDKIAPGWDEPYFQIQLKAGDDLTFSVFDEDPGIPDTQMLKCKLELKSTSASVGQQCRPDPDSDYYVTVEFSPVPVTTPE